MTQPRASAATKTLTPEQHVEHFALISRIQEAKVSALEAENLALRQRLAAADPPAERRLQARC